MNEHAAVRPARGIRPLLVWNVLVLVALIILMIVTWWTYPVTLWSLGDDLLVYQETETFPDVLLIGTVSVAAVQTRVVDTGEESGVLYAFNLTPGSSASGFYVDPERLAIPEEGIVELSVTFSTTGAGRLLFDWLPRDQVQSEGSQTQVLSFGAETAGQILADNLDPFSARAVHGLGLRVVSPDNVAVNLVDIEMVNTTSLHGWRRGS